MIYFEAEANVSNRPIDDIWTTIFITSLKSAQLAISVGIIGLLWLIYPGAMVIFATAAGLLTCPHKLVQVES